MDQPHALPPRLVALLQDMPLEELAFVAVPVRARHDGWTKARQQGFILRLALGGCVTLAAKAVGKTKASAYRLRERPGAESFAAAWDRALGWGRSRAVDLGMERAILGEEVPVMYRGRRVGTRQVHDNRLLIAVLNAIGPLAPDPTPGDDPNLAFRRALDALAPDPAPTEIAGFSRGI
ncbi:MAG: hypothetical protein ACT4N8_12690 [Sphingosinicella sp.]|uniref:hypothetical protein n=1 Tax=Sphingosinicella sp. TaxID=1917971 RepID=UPI004037DEEB